MADTDCPNCGNGGRLATNHSLDWFRCTKCRATYAVDHTTCSVSGCASWVDDEASGLCHYHAAHQGIYPEGEPYRADHAKAADEHERPPTCSQAGCIALADRDGRCWQHGQPATAEDDRPESPESDEDGMCAHAGCPNEPREDGVCWHHAQAARHPDRTPDPFRHGRD